jgi:short subunit dehydrogenase-like uncharacterized protein
MRETVLLYGATGYMGRLIAAEHRRVCGTSPPRMILAGRGGNALAELAQELGMQFRAFGLDDKRTVMRGLRDVGVVINAAGPFACTARPLLEAAIDVGCHYVDINGALDVYVDLAGLVKKAAAKLPFADRGVAVVCGAGHTPAASDLMMNAALGSLEAGVELGAVRIALSCTKILSRGSAETLLGSLREQVTVVRAGRLWHEPVGRLERTFDFCGAAPPERDLRVTSAANLIDTVTAQQTIANDTRSVKTIESYVEAGAPERLAYQLGALVAPIVTLRPVQFLLRQQIDFLPPGPTDDELKEEKEIVLLDVEDHLRTRIIDWRWETPNAYQFTAQVVVEIAKKLINGAFTGWVTPGAAFGPNKGDLTATAGALRNCRLSARI